MQHSKLKNSPKNISKRYQLVQGTSIYFSPVCQVLIFSISTNVRKLKHLSRITACSPFSGSTLQMTYKFRKVSPTQITKKANPHSHFRIVWHFLELYFCFLSLLLRGLICHISKHFQPKSFQREAESHLSSKLFRTA